MYHGIHRPPTNEMSSRTLPPLHPPRRPTCSARACSMTRIGAAALAALLLVLCLGQGVAPAQGQSFDPLWGSFTIASTV